MAIHPVNQVTDSLIHLARERGVRDVTNLKLQKLLYYSQAWRLAFTGRPLFRDDIEAWVHGPVIPSVFRRFKTFGWKTIESDVAPHDDVELSSHLRSILKAYGSFGATQLERLTHSEDPWKIARGQLAPDVSSNAIISRDDMKAFYRARARGGR